MTTKLFKNVGDNQFKLITENVAPITTSPSVGALQSGLKKVFSEGVGEISYTKIQNMGLGFIKDVFSAKKCALDESRILAEEFGYKDDECNKKFVKEDGEMSSYDVGNYENEPKHSETDMANKEEKREVQIGKSIMRYANEISERADLETLKSYIIELANELVVMHGGESKFKTHPEA